MARWWWAMVVLGGCADVRRPTVTLGDPVPTVVQVAFSSELRGDGIVYWEVDGVRRGRNLGPTDGGGWETAIWLPAGRAARVWGAVARGGEVVEGPARRVRVPRAPRNIRWDVTYADPDRSRIGDGVLLANAYSRDTGESYAMVIDGDGEVLWWAEPDRDDQRFLRLRPGLDGHSLVAARWAEDHVVADDGYITRFDLSAGQARTDTRALALHHDFVELPGERFAWLSWVWADQAEVEGVGAVPVAADAIRIAPEGAVEGEEEILYDLLRDYPHPIYKPCGHMGPGGFAGPVYWEWSHGNSIAYDPDADAIRFLARYWDAVLEVGLDGALHWQAGGKHSDFELDGWFDHAHASELVGDTLVVFDNRNHHPDPVSGAAAFELDFAAREGRELWRIDDPEGKFTTYLGDVRMLPGGHALVLFSPEGRLVEFAPDGEVVWEARIRGDLVVGRLAWTDQLAPR